MENNDYINPLVEFDPCPLSNEVTILVRETEQYLEEQARPIVTTIKKYGWMVIESIAKSGGGIGIYPPRL